MPDTNRISVSLTAEQMNSILTAFGGLSSQLEFLIHLTPEDRHSMPKMSDKSVAFDEKCAHYMETQPDLIPSFVDVEEIEKDRKLRNQLLTLASEINALASGVNDTIMIASSELWMADLAFYQNVRQAAKRGVPGAQTAYEDLSARFPGTAAKASAKAAAKAAAKTA